MSEHHNNDKHDSKHGYYTGDIHNQFVEEHHQSNSVSSIWKTFWILLVITLFEVGIAFTSIPHSILIVIFIVHEKQALRYSIVLPFLLILYLIVMALAEGNYLNLVG